MLTLSKTADYADVFLEKSTTGGLGLVMVILMVLGMVGLFASIGLFDDEDWLMLGSAILLMVGFGGLVLSTVASQYVDAAGRENMVANIRAKYDAELNTSNLSIRRSELAEPHEYTLKFENGTSGDYRIYFTKDSEPIIVDPSKSPSPTELNAKANSDKEESTPSSKETTPSEDTKNHEFAPTPTELNKSAEK